jgi:hypothetical protein
MVPPANGNFFSVPEPSIYRPGPLPGQSPRRRRVAPPRVSGHDRPEFPCPLPGQSPRRRRVAPRGLRARSPRASRSLAGAIPPAQTCSTPGSPGMTAPNFPSLAGAIPPAQTCSRPNSVPFANSQFTNIAAPPRIDPPVASRVTEHLAMSHGKFDESLIK